MKIKVATVRVLNCASLWFARKSVIKNIKQVNVRAWMRSWHASGELCGRELRVARTGTCTTYLRLTASHAHVVLCSSLRSSSQIFEQKKDCSQPSLRAGNSQIGFCVRCYEYQVLWVPSANALVLSDTYTSRHSVTAVREILEGLQWGGEQRTFSFSGVVILKYKVDRISMASKWQT